MDRRAVLSMCSDSCNHHGSCWTNGDLYECRCRTDYYGKACEYAQKMVAVVTPPESVSESTDIGFYMLIAFAILCLVLLGWCSWILWSRRQITDSLIGKITDDVRMPTCMDGLLNCVETGLNK